MASSIVLKKTTGILSLSKFLRPLTSSSIAVQSRNLKTKAQFTDKDDSSDDDDETVDKNGYGGMLKDEFGNMIFCYDVVRYYQSFGIEKLFPDEAPTDNPSD